MSSGDDFSENKTSGMSVWPHIRETSYHSIKLHLKQVFQSVYRHELETKLSKKPSWKQEIAKIPDWPTRKTVAEFRLCVGRDCLGTYFHRIGIRPVPYCVLCSLREPMDRNHLGQCTALFNRTGCGNTGRPGQKWRKIDFVFFFYYYPLWLLLIIRTFIFVLCIFLVFIVYF